MKRPNILLITTDQQRGDCLGCAGHPVLETPYLDQLAEKGCRFDHAYTAVPACTPARAAIITGMDQWNHGRLSMSGTDFLRYPATLPECLGRAGYHTQAVGKMHFAPQRARYGFDHMVLDESSRVETPNFVSDYREWFERNKQGPYGYRDHSVDWNSWMARPSHLPEYLHPTWWTAEEGIRFLRRRDPIQPFFLWLSFARPHSPYDAPEPYFSMYDGNPDIPEPYTGEWSEPFRKRIADINAPRSCRTPAETRRARAGYYGNITFIDHQIGRVLYELRKMDPDAAANTLIIFTSDHGDMMGDHHHWRKTYAYEGSARVPMIISWPMTWDLARNITHDAVVEMRDIMPTILDAAGVDIPDSVDGESMIAAVRDRLPGREWFMGEYTACYDPRYGMQFGVSATEKYIWFHHTGDEQFFDLANDRGETRNLIDDPAWAARIDLWRQRLAETNERRGDPRGKNGKLVVQPNFSALPRSPNYDRWKQAGLKVWNPAGR